MLCSLAGAAGANGRPPGTDSIEFKQGTTSSTDIIAGLTFGLIISHDSGATWQWMCEAAVGYQGTYDPVYAYSQSGAIFATTFDGFTAMRDGCTFNNYATTPPGTTFVSADVLGPDHALYYGAADMHDANVYRSADDGMTFPQVWQSGLNQPWWESVMVAPSDATRVYLSGYLLANNTKSFLLYTSVDGGKTFTALPQTGLTDAANSAISIVGVSPTDPTLVYVRVTLENNVLGDGIYKMKVGTDTSWTRIFGKLDSVFFVARANGDIVAITPTLGGSVSHDQGATWTVLTSPPHANCLTESPDGWVWACSQNYGQNGIQSDGYGIMKSQDLATWTGVIRYQDISGPVSCAPGTVQHDTCDAMTWCSLRMQLGIIPNPTNCPDTSGSEPSDAKSTGKTGSAGCCDTGAGGGPVALLGSLMVGALLVRRRRAKLG
ncbi:MAG TPA: hypothetical protein VLX92_31875 [Kofleriaceae bacterium]|nr:hypothetical protein [Kofleriaceae bacterium]